METENSQFSLKLLLFSLKSSQKSANYWSFHSLIEYAKSNNCEEYSKNYHIFCDQIKFPKALIKETPSFSELRRNFNCFMYYRRSKHRTDSILKYWNKKHLSVLLYIFSFIKVHSKISPDQYSIKLWAEISELLPSTSAESLKYRWFSLAHDPSDFQNEWTSNDDSALMDVICENEPNLLDFSSQTSCKVRWSQLAMKFNNVSNHPKLGKHCKERWLNHLSPYLNKNPWTDQEDILLLEQALAHNNKWSKITQVFPGRTQHNIKNRFMSLIAREHKVSTKKLTIKGSYCRNLVMKTLVSLQKSLVNSLNIRILLQKEETPTNSENKVSDFMGFEGNLFNETPTNNPLSFFNYMKSEEETLKKNVNNVNEVGFSEKIDQQCSPKEKFELKSGENYEENMDFFNLM